MKFVKCNLCRESEGNCTSSSILKGPLCRKCSEMDLEMAHKLATAKKDLVEKERIQDEVDKLFKEELAALEKKIGYKCLKFLRII